MLERLLKIFPWVIGLIILINLLFLDFVWLKKPQPEKNSQTTATVDINCSTCQKIITDEIAKEVAKITPVIEKQIVQPTSVPKSVSTPTTSPQAKAIFIPIGTSGTTNNTGWTDIAATDFYFDLADYSQAKSVNFQATIQSYPSKDSVYLRLYDVTNNRGVDGSELITDSTSYVLVTSAPLSIWRGNNLYRIQAKGINGNVVNFSTPKLKVNF